MASIQWRPEYNVLTVPPSYRSRFVPRDSVGTDELAPAMAEENLNYTVDEVRDQHYGRLADVRAGE